MQQQECYILTMYLKRGYTDLNPNPLSIPYWNYDRVETTLGDMSEAELKAEFRFGSGEINLLYEALRIPESFTCINRTVATGLEGLLMFLKHFAYPCRLGDMIPRFGCSIPELSLILSEITEFIVSTHGHLLRDIDQHNWSCLPGRSARGVLRWPAAGDLRMVQLDLSVAQESTKGSCTMAINECMA